MTPKDLTDMILFTRASYILSKKSVSHFEINNGLCEDFALEVKKSLGNHKEIWDLEGGNFQDEDGLWDWGLLEKSWNISQPKGLTKEETDRIPFGNHVFLVYKNKFYDCECPQGVDSIFDIPLFRRYVIQALREKGIHTPDIVTDDVRPVPLCPVPNPPKRNQQSVEFSI